MLHLSTGLYELRYRDPFGGPGWRLVIPNGVTVEGANYSLEAGFRGGPKYATWYAGLIDDVGFSGLSNGDTHASHPGWAEFAGIYNSLRPAWTTSPAAGGVLTSSASTTFQITSAGTVRGTFLASRQAVGTGAGPVLYSTAAAAAGRAVSPGGILTLSYSLRLNPR